MLPQPGARRGASAAASWLLDACGGLRSLAGAAGGSSGPVQAAGAAAVQDKEPAEMKAPAPKKRALSAYNFFLSMEKQRLKQDTKGSAFKGAAVIWNSMTPEQRAPYEAEAAKSRAAAAAEREAQKAARGPPSAYVEFIRAWHDRNKATGAGHGGFEQAAAAWRALPAADRKRLGKAAAARREEWKEAQEQEQPLP